MSELIFRRAGEDLMRVNLDRPRMSFGRGGQSDVAIPDDGISRAQFTIEQRGSRSHLVDLSGRGTRVEGMIARDTELHDGAEIALGAWSALYRQSDRGAEGVTDPRARGARTEPLPHALGSPREREVRLRVVSGDRARAIEWEGPSLSIGSGARNQLILRGDRYVSTAHAQLHRSPRGFWVRDLGSTNGTFVDGHRVREAELALGSVLRVGETELTLEATDPEPTAPASEGFVGKDPALLKVLDQVDRVAPTTVSVTVFGETGTGKELVARELHRRSLRRRQPFVAVNCAALHRELIESELFGHEKGAFTGADRQRSGAFEDASTGTLFLDEVGELPPDLQAKLLRVLETGEVRRLGASKPLRVDVRIIAATHVDLFRQVQLRQFREDLFYRLCVFPLTLPALRDRPGDVLALAHTFLRAHEVSGRRVPLSRAAEAKLLGHAFPGNVRELRNVIQRALVLRQGPAILPEHLVFDAPYRTEAPLDAARDDEKYLYLPGRTMLECRDQIVIRGARRNRDKSKTAQELGISRTTVIQTCKRLPG